MADSIGNHNPRDFAEPSGGYWRTKTSFLRNEYSHDPLIQFYDSLYTQVLLLTAPRGRSREQSFGEKNEHGCPSFRDDCDALESRRCQLHQSSDEVEWNNVVLRGNEVVSKDVTHLGHNLPDT